MTREEFLTDILSTTRDAEGTAIFDVTEGGSATLSSIVIGELALTRAQLVLATTEHDVLALENTFENHRDDDDGGYCAATGRLYPSEAEDIRDTWIAGR